MGSDVYLSFDALFLATYNREHPLEELFDQGWSGISLARPLLKGFYGIFPNS